MTELEYIGHRLTTPEVKPDPTKVSVIKEMAEPTSPQVVHRFLGIHVCSQVLIVELITDKVTHTTSSLKQKLSFIGKKWHSSKSRH